jgi:RNA polymerase-binding transcription factor DksA
MSEDREHLSDQLDVAQQVTEQVTQDRVDHYRRLAQPEQVRGDDGTWPEVECRDCGDALVDARREMGKVRCISCQEILEKKLRFRR